MAADVTPFSGSAEFYDLVYSAKDTEREADQFLKAARSVVPAQKVESTIDLGIGTGRHAKILAGQGITVHGIDLSQEMVDKIGDLPGIQARLGDASDFELGIKVDAVFAFFHVASYQVEDSDINGMFSCARKHLNTHGAFIFDTWYTPGVLALRPERRVVEVEREGEKILRLSESSEDVDKSLVEVTQKYTVSRTDGTTSREFTEVHRMRHFSTNEIRFLASQHGFAVQKIASSNSGLAPGLTDWSCLYTLRAV